MTPTRFRECLDLCSWSQRHLARITGAQDGTVRKWATGRYYIPKEVADWLETLASCHERNPPPENIGSGSIG